MTTRDSVQRLAPIADRVARDIYRRPIHPTLSQESVVRDACDLASVGDLDTLQLDILVEMVEARLRNPFTYGLSDAVDPRLRRRRRTLR